LSKLIKLALSRGGIGVLLKTSILDLNK